MKIKQSIDKVPGGLMVIPLLAGALLNTIDQLHLAFIMDILKSLGVAPTADGHYEFLKIGGFTQALFKDGALTLQGLVAVASAQISIATISTAFLVPIAVILADKYQKKRGIDGKIEFFDEKSSGKSSGTIEDASI